MTCNFFQWAEPPFTERAREVIEELIVKLEAKTEEVENLIGEKNFNDRKAIVLNEALTSGKKQSKETEELKKLLLKKDKEIRFLRKSLLVVVFFILIVIFKN